MSTVRHNETIDHNERVIEAYIGGTRAPSFAYMGYQWKFVGDWTQADMDTVEGTLLSSGETYPYRNHWEIYDGTWGNMYRFIAKRYTWEYGPYCHGNTAEELARAIKEYYERSKRAAGLE